MIGVTDPSWISRRLSGSVPIDAATLLVVTDYIDEDITAVMSRTKDHATNLCLSHNDANITTHMQTHPPPAGAAPAIRIA